MYIYIYIYIYHSSRMMVSLAAEAAIAGWRALCAERRRDRAVAELQADLNNDHQYEI